MKRDDERIPPHDADAEQAVLGACLLGGLALVGALDVLGDDDAVFYREAHRRIWRAILAVVDRGEAVDVVTVAAEIERRGDTNATGGMAYLVDLASSVPTTANVGEYAAIVAGYARRRKLIAAAERATARAYDRASNDMEVAAELRAALDEAAATRGDPLPARQVLGDAVSDAERRVRENRAGLDLGFPDLTRRIGTLPPGTLMVVSAAETSQGKTSLVLQAAAWAATHGHRALACSIELTAEQVGDRLATQFAGRGLRAPRWLTDDDWTHLHAAQDQVPDGLWLDCGPRTSTEVAARAALWASRVGGLDLILVDGLHDLSDEPRKGEREEQVLARAAQRMRELAQRLGCVVIMTAQPSMGGAKEGRRPRTSDLRGSGRIGQVAAVVLFIWRKPDAQERDGVISCEWVLAKCLGGATGYWQMDFEPARARWRTPIGERWGSTANSERGN